MKRPIDCAPTEESWGPTDIMWLSSSSNPRPISKPVSVRYRSYSVTETPPDEPESTTDVGFFTIEVAGRLHLGR